MKEENNTLPTVIFFKDGHTYWHNQRKMQSANQYIKQYVPDDFVDDYWAIHRALEKLFPEAYPAARSGFNMVKPPADKIFPQFIRQVKPREFIKERDLVLESWEYNRVMSAYLGTKFHADMEAEDYARGYVVNPYDDKRYPVQSFDKQWDNQSFSEDLYELPDGVHLELLLFNLDLNLAGQADKVFIETIGDTRFIDIDDWKTNKKKPSKSGTMFGEGPLSNLRMCKVTDYALQIGAYAWMLEQFGFTPRNLGFTWVKNYNKEDTLLFELPYLNKQLKKIFENK